MPPPPPDPIPFHHLSTIHTHAYVKHTCKKGTKKECVPMWSALSIPRSKSSRTERVRKISEEGKGVWRKRPCCVDGGGLIDLID